MKFDLEERTGMKTDPEKAAVDMRMGRNPDTSRIFERKDWPTRTQVQGFLGRRTFTERRRSNKDLRCWKTWPATLVFNTPFAMTLTACVTSRMTENYLTLSLVMVKEMLTTLLFLTLPEIEKQLWSLNFRHS